MSGLLHNIQEHLSEHSQCALHYLHEARVGFNNLCANLEAWQLVFYTLTATFLVLWVRRLFNSDKRKYFKEDFRLL